MNSYEIIFVLKPDLSEDEKEKTISKVEEIISSNDGKVSLINKWGIKKIEYEIKGYKEGFYVYIKFKGYGNLISILNHNCMVNDSIIRFLITRLKEDISIDPVSQNA